MSLLKKISTIIELKNIKLFFLSVSIFSLLILLPACSDTPSDIGEDLLAKDDLQVVNIDSFNDTLKQFSSSYKTPIKLGLADVIILGKQSRLQSNFAIKFAINLSETIKLKMDSLIIVSNEIIFKPVYRFGDTAATFDFTAHKILNVWDPLTLNSNDMEQIQFANNNSITSRSISDTLVKVSLDNNLVREWFQFAKDSNTFNTNGVMLRPSLNTGRFVGFRASTLQFDDAPYLRVITKIGPTGTNDTLNFIVNADIHFVDGDVNTTDKTILTTQSGIAVHSNLWFDISSIPKTAIVNNAFITLTIDTLRTRVGNTFANSLIVYLSTDSTTNARDGNYYTVLSRENNTFKGDISFMVNRWIKDGTNNGLILMNLDENVGLESFQIFGSGNVNAALRPRLNIIYSQKK